MPRRAKGPRLYWIAGRGWVIRDTGQPQRSCGTDDRGEAERQLADYIAAKQRRSGPAAPDRLTVADALLVYGEDHAPHTADPARIGYAISALLSWWGASPVSAITGATCRRYVAERGVAASTARRELGCLQAALRHCEREGYLVQPPKVTLPPKPQPKDRWLTESEAARLVWSARRTPHLARFVLLGLYTGTRRDAILSLRWRPHLAGGWIDVDRGILYRSAAEAVQTRKRKTPARLPRKILAHCRRWRDLDGGDGWVAHFRGARVGSIKTAWGKLRERADLPDATPHVLRHTAITWSMQRGVPLADAAGYFGITVAELERTYLHHHPSFQAGAARAMDRG